jgi:hypothetical protein
VREWVWSSLMWVWLIKWTYGYTDPHPPASQCATPEITMATEKINSYTMLCIPVYPFIHIHVPYSGEIFVGSNFHGFRG